jgi:multidrug efflux system membrane fusion protein
MRFSFPQWNSAAAHIVSETMEDRAHPRRANRWVWLAVAGVVAAGGLYSYYGGGSRAMEAKDAPKKGARAPSAVPVSIAAAMQKDIPFRLQAIGNVEASANVALKARVDGHIVHVGFKEGQEVRKGQVLFRIDPRAYETALRQAEANHLRDTAQRDQARSQARRYEELLQKNFVSKEAYAQIRTSADTAEAVAQGSKAAVDTAKLNLDYCTIRSPIDGYAGKIQIQLGNLVKANDTVSLVSLNQVHPIYVNFSVPEQRLPSIRSYLARGAVSVDALLQSGQTAVGNLVFIDNAVDPSTGTIRLRAQFPNSDNALWPGQFVTTSVRLYEQKNALIVPTQAVQTGPDGQYVFVVKADMSIELRAVTVERTEGDHSIIAAGLKPGEQVVTQGQLRLSPGVKVAVKSPGPAP